MSTTTNIDMPATRRRVYAELATLLTGRGFVARAHRRAVIYRRRDGTESTITLTRYNVAGSTTVGCIAPLTADVLRFHVDHHNIRRPGSSMMVRPLGPKLEVSFHVDELDVFMAWIPAWIADHNIAPPVRMDRSEKRLEHYAWSARGDDLYVRRRVATH